MIGISGELKVYTLIRIAYMVPVRKEDAQLHWHDYYQFVYARKGKGFIVTDKETIPLSEKEAVILRRNEPHALISGGGKFETYEVKFVLCDSEKDILGKGQRFSCRDALGEINLALRQMERESDKLDGLSREIVAAEMYKILLLMKRELDQTKKEGKEKPAQANYLTDDELLRKIDIYINGNMDRNITVKAVAEHMGFEYKYFSRYFASRYGLRLKQYIATRQLEKVKELLGSTDLSITAIAQQCGFGDGRHLARRFKISEDLSPTEFRKRFRSSHTVKLEAAPKIFYDSPKEE